MNVLLLTNEYPPNIYGGAGVHIEHLSRELARIAGIDLQVFYFGDQDSRLPSLSATGVSPVVEVPAVDRQRAKLLDALQRNIAMTGLAVSADIIHCHTWYSHLAGCLLKQILGCPLVLTSHSLEPHRPWKKEQLGSSYYAACWLERTAMATADGIIAVSKAMKRDAQQLFEVEPDRIEVIYNGIDTERFRRIEQPETLKQFGIDPERPFVLFVGRATRQKGILHLVEALPHLDQGMQAILCAGMPDTPEIGREMKLAVESARKRTDNDIIWIEQMVPPEHLVALYSHAAVFVCPSVYEPFGIINLEAMACHTPVVAAAVGGIPEIVVPGETGLLVAFEPVSDTDPEPRHPERYARELAAAINTLMASEPQRRRMAAAGRLRVENRFSWQSIANQTQAFYQRLLDNRPIRTC